MSIDYVDQTFYCCGRCKGLWPIHRQLLKHKDVCVGDIALSDCDTFACERSLYISLRCLGVKHVETLEETVTAKATPLQHDPHEGCSGTATGVTDTAVQVKREIGVPAQSDVTSADINAEDEKRSHTEVREVTPRRGRRRRAPHRWADEDVNVVSPHSRRSKKQCSEPRDLSSWTTISPIASRGMLRELPCKDNTCDDADQQAESRPSGVNTTAVISSSAKEQSEHSRSAAAEVVSSNSQEQSGHSNSGAVVTGNDDTVSVKQDNADVQLSDDGQGVECKDEDEPLAQYGESEKDDDSTTVSHRQTTTGTARPAQRASCDEYLVTETHQLPSGAMTTRKYYKCPTCAWRTKHVGFFARHLRVSHDDGRAWTCDQCAFTCTSKKHMTKHRNTHTRPFLCQYCSVRYSEQRELERHIWKHKGEFPFCCSVCDYKSRFSNALKEHVRKHTGEKLRCPVAECGFATNYQYALTAHHAAKHAPEKRFTCAACGYRTSDRGSFTKHTKLHLGAKDFKCGECDYRGVTRYDIVKHMRSHTKEKLYFCDRCEFATSYSSGLRLHLMAHLGVKPWQCSLCGYNSVTRSKIVRHIRQRHADSPQGGSVINLGLKLDMRARDYRQRSRPAGQLSAVATEYTPVEEVQYELLDIPLTMLEGAEVSVKTTSGVDEHAQSEELTQQPEEDTVSVGAELTLISTTTATGVREKSS